MSTEVTTEHGSERRIHPMSGTIKLYVITATDDEEAMWPAQWPPRNPPADSPWPVAPGGLDQVFFWDEAEARTALEAYLDQQPNRQALYELSVETWDVPAPVLHMVFEDGGFDGTTFRGAWPTKGEASTQAERAKADTLPAAIGVIVVPYTVGEALRDYSFGSVSA